METKIEKIAATQHTYTVTISGLTEKEKETLRRIFGANLTLPKYFDAFTTTDYGHNEVYKFLAKLAEGMDRRVD